MCVYNCGNIKADWFSYFKRGSLIYTDRKVVSMDVLLELDTRLTIWQYRDFFSIGDWRYCNQNRPKL